MIAPALVIAGLAAAWPVRAQSLADVAKQEENRRKDVKAPAKLYTNKDFGAPPPVFSSPTPVDDKKPAVADDKGKDQGKDAAPKDTAVKDQKYWSDKRKELDAKLERDKVLAEAMQSRINGLTADFAARSDPAQRAVIERDRLRALAELDALQKTIKEDQKAIADFNEDARKASVPPGWLR